MSWRWAGLSWSWVELSSEVSRSLPKASPLQHIHSLSWIDLSQFLTSSGFGSGDLQKGRCSMGVGLYGCGAYTRMTVSYGELPWEFPLRTIQGSERWLLPSLQLWLSLALVSCGLPLLVTGLSMWSFHSDCWLSHPTCTISSSGEIASCPHHPEYRVLTTVQSSLASAEPERWWSFQFLDPDFFWVKCSADANGYLYPRSQGCYGLSEWVVSAHYLDVMRESCSFPYADPV